MPFAGRAVSNGSDGICWNAKDEGTKRRQRFRCELRVRLAGLFNPSQTMFPLLHQCRCWPSALNIYRLHFHQRRCFSQIYDFPLDVLTLLLGKSLQGTEPLFCRKEKIVSVYVWLVLVSCFQLQRKR